MKESHCLLFFFNDTATTEIYTLSLHDALPISTSTRRTASRARSSLRGRPRGRLRGTTAPRSKIDRKSTRLNSSHANISYAVFCLKKKKSNYHRTASSLCNIVRVRSHRQSSAHH